MKQPQKKLHPHGPWFRDKREKAGLTQKALAEKVEVDRSYITQIESGMRWPSKPTQYAIYTAMGVPIDQAIRELHLVSNEEADRVLQFRELIEEVAPRMSPKRVKAFEQMFASDSEQLRWVTAQVLSEPLPPAPDGWIRLKKEDRRLVQRLVNRLLDSYDEEVPDADQAQ